MKKVMLLGVAIFAFSVQAHAGHDHFHNRAQVAQAAQALADAVEQFDSALHRVNAPRHFIQEVHHFEETVVDFTDDIRGGMSYNEAVDDYNHIRADLSEVQTEMYSHPLLLISSRVRRGFRAVNRAFNNLYTQMKHAHHHH